MERKQDFCEGWRFHQGEFKRPIPKITTKTGTCGGASNLTEEEGFVYRLHPYMAEKMRVENGNHLYHVAKELEGEWVDVTLPHDWTAFLSCEKPGEGEDETSAVEAGYLPAGVGYYRKRFCVPAESLGKRIVVEFEGITRESTVWVNGCYIASHLSGYTGFACDVTEYLFYGEEGENVILVKAENHLHEGWWAEGAGICRPVWLYELDPVHVKRHGTFIWCEKITDGGDGKENATIHVRTNTQNDGGEAASVCVRTRIFPARSVRTDVDALSGGAGATATVQDENVRLENASTENASTENAPAEGSLAEARRDVGVEWLADAGTESVLEVFDIQRWNLENPVLYTVVTDVLKGGVVVDHVEERFGIRKVRHGANGLCLNGRIVEIKGVCVHQDFAGVGNALTPDLIRYRLQKIKDMGGNAYRSAHHPASEELLRACDEMGILVLNENRRFEMTKESREDLRELIEGSRNHPCVFMWSLENEELMPTMKNGKRLLKALVDYAHKLDPTKQCTVAGHFACRDEEYVKIPDVAGFNYDMDDAGAMRERVPGLLTIASEDGSFVSTRGEYADDREKGVCDCYDSGSYMVKLMMEQMGMKEMPIGTLGGASSPNNLAYSWNHYAKKAPWLCGMFVWTAFDYRGESFPWNWPAVTSGYGAMDICGFEKDSFYYWKSLWSGEAMVHLLPHWNWREKEPVQVDVYTNCGEVELFLNGRSLGRRAHEKGDISSWSVEFEPGRLEAVAYRDGAAVARDERTTTKEPSKVLVEECFRGEQEVLYKIMAEDEDGRVVPTARVDLELDVEDGVILGTGNGNPARHEPLASTRINTFHGLALAVVRKAGKDRMPKLHVRNVKEERI